MRQADPNGSACFALRALRCLRRELCCTCVVPFWVARGIAACHGTCMDIIANFLYLNGVTYNYERTYAHDVADATHSQYRPDFYYPDIDVWHEHWALGCDGNPPAEFVGYAQQMAWKRGIHQQFGTTLIETTFADVVFGDGLVELERKLTPGPEPSIGRDQPLAHLAHAEAA